MVTSCSEKSAVLLRIFRNAAANNSVPVIVYLFIGYYERNGKIRNETAKNPHYCCKFFDYA